MAITPKSGVLVRSAEIPLYRQIYAHYRQAIVAGQLLPGDRMPSIRDLAHRFQTARGTVDAAYAMLAGEGYIVGRGPAGTIVARDIDTAAIAGAQPRPIAARHAAAPTPQAPRLLQMGLPALDAFPRKLWAHTMARGARKFSPDDMVYPSPVGAWPLRQAIAAYLATSRGIACTAEQIVVTDGFQGGLDLTLRLLLRQGDQAWIEDPCYLPIRAALDAAGARLVPVRVDDHGLRVADAIARARRARLAVVTPSHQSPLGVSLSLPRRLALLRWAGDAGAYVIEDDYDSEFRFQGRPLPALKSLDHDQRVVYAGTFSKVLFPGLRLGYLVLPDALLAPFTAALSRLNAGRATFLQDVVAAFMTEGHFARHLRRMRRLYAARREALATALTATFRDRIVIALQPGGMHLVVRFRDRASDVTLAKRAQAAGFAVDALSTRAIASCTDAGLLLGFTNVAEADAMDIARKLARALKI